MKLISIKCPNCSGKLNLEKEQEVITCTYCKSQIYIDDEKIKLERENNKRINNYLKLANRFFDDCEYEEAYIKYDQTLVLQPDNYEAIFKRGLCVSLNSSYVNFDIKSSFNGFKNAVYVLRNLSNNEDINQIINSYALELLDVILKLKEFVMDFYEKHLFTKNELMIYIERLYSCLYILEKVYNLTYELNNKTKIKYNSSIYKLINEIKKSKKYSDFYEVETGNPIVIKYYLSNKECKKLNKKMKKYKQDMLLINDKFRINYELLKKQRIVIITFEIILISILILMFIKYKNILWNILLILDIILFSFDIFGKVLIKNNKFLFIVKLLISLIAIVGYLIS